jgi:hypothetical protein
LFRIDHFDLHKPLGMRLLATACCTTSSDASFTAVMLYGIPNLEQLADTLRVFAARRGGRRVTTLVDVTVHRTA